MSYDDAFFERYRRYLEEPTVRRNHDDAFEWLNRDTDRRLQYVLDIGCGVGEFFIHGPTTNYIGIDSFPRVIPSIAADYTNVKEWKPKLPAWDPYVFVSLFSVECCLPSAKKYAFYERLFLEFPSIQFGFVSGFYYGHCPDQLTVGETGGIESYQTIEPLGSHVSKIFDEKRLVMHTPSEMFGEDVYEVWKILSRNIEEDKS